MYKYIIGDVVDSKMNYIVLENNKIGYKIFVANPFSFILNEECKIYLYNHLREDENSLYGFDEEKELDLFLKLINVKGLGPKVALGFFATGSISGIVDAINRENILYLKKFPKVGDKLAKQIILDLKNKLNIEVDQSDINNTGDVVLALEALGYKSVDIKRVISQIDASLNVERQIKESLKLLLK